VVWQCAAVKLPNPEKAVVERGKVVDYLLNSAHPDNGGKAAFFEGLGFDNKNGKKWRSRCRHWPPVPK